MRNQGTISVLTFCAFTGLTNVCLCRQGRRKESVRNSADVGAAGSAAPPLRPRDGTGLFLCYVSELCSCISHVLPASPIGRALACGMQDSAHRGAGGLKGHVSGSGAFPSILQ